MQVNQIQLPAGDVIFMRQFSVTRPNKRFFKARNALPSIAAEGA